MTSDIVAGDRGLFFAAESPPEERRPERVWRILIVDDDEAVHVVTRLVLRGKVVFGRALELVGFTSAREALEYLAKESDVACILLDVVMEENDSGLKLVRHLREEIGNDATRIVLRTGQPGQAPESKVIVDYAINDYKEKTELTEQKLFTTVVTAIRSYRDIVTIAESREGMRTMVGAAAELFSVRSPDLFAKTALETLLSLPHVSGHAIYGQAPGAKEGAAFDLDGFVITAATGRFQASVGRPFIEVIPTGGRLLVLQTLASPRPLWEGGSLAIPLRHDGRLRGLIHVEDCPSPDDIGVELISLFATAVSEALASASMFRELESAFREREALIREIHHRVRNNLQLVSGLIQLALSDSSLSPLDTLRDTARRVESMAAVHASVFAAGRLESVDFAAFMPDLVETIREDCDVGRHGLDAKVEVRNFVLPLAKAIPCALILTELIGAAFECHMRSGGGAPLEISLGRRDDTPGYRCRIGALGCAEGEGDLFADSGAVSSQLLSALTGQIKGVLRVDRGDCLSIELLLPDA